MQNSYTNNRDGLETQPRTVGKTAALLLAAAFFASSASASYWTGMTWQAPFNPENTGMPAHLATASSADVDFTVDLSDINGNNITLQRKLASEDSWSNVSETVTDTDWIYSGGSGNQDLEGNEIVFPGRQETDLLSEGEQVTYSIDGNEHTVTFYDGIESSPDEADISIDGSDTTLYEGEAAFVDGQYIRIDFISICDGCDDAVSLALEDDSYSLSQDRYEYRVFYKGYGYSKPIYFDINSAGSGLNVPYVENVSFSDYGRVFDFQTGDGVAPGSTMYVTVKQQEGDRFNLTLRDRDQSRNIQEVDVSGDGILNTIYSSIIDSTLGIFSDGAILQGTDTYVIPFQMTSETSFLSKQDNKYSFGFKVEESSGFRDTATYTVNTSGTNSPPSIDAVEGSCDLSSWSNLSSFDSSFQCLRYIRVTATDQNDETLFAQMNLTEVYDQVQRSRFNDSYGYHIKNGSNYIFNLSKSEVPTSSINESGDWEAEFTVSDGSQTVSETVQWSVPWGTAEVDVLKPANPITVLDNESFSFDFRVTCSGGPECFNENETWKLFPDPQSTGGVFS
jgi:hypothetical protein